MKKNFGDVLKKIRRDLNISQFEASIYSDLSEETIRRTEKGLTNPSFETLSKLTNLYGVNLFDLAFEYTKVDYRLSKFFEDLEKNIRESDYSQYSENYLKFTNYLTDYYGASTNKVLLKKLNFYNGIYNLYSGHLSQALDYYEKSILITNPKFNINKLGENKLNKNDLRAIMNISFIKRKEKDVDEYLKLIEFVYKQSRIKSIDLHILCTYNLAAGYSYLNKLSKALSFANMGIELSYKYTNNNYLIYLYYIKGCVEYKLSLSSSMESLQASRYGCILTNNVKLKNIIEENLKYNFSLNITENPTFMLGSQLYYYVNMMIKATKGVIMKLSMKYIILLLITCAVISTISKDYMLVEEKIIEVCEKQKYIKNCKSLSIENSGVKYEIIKV